MPTETKTGLMNTKYRTNWKNIWDAKGDSNIMDLKVLSGHENTPIEPRGLATLISDNMKLETDDKVLEVGAGAGMIAQYLLCDYTGSDYSESLCHKHRQILGNVVVHCAADSLPFEDNSFDKVFAFSVFHYFDNHDYAIRVLREMERVATKLVFIGDLPYQSHDSDHLLYTKEMFPDWHPIDGFYRDTRFNILKKL